jgi:phosphoribosylformylglycinamidine (FGAM) synthase-like amidotransferase family enzyme
VSRRIAIAPDRLDTPFTHLLGERRPLRMPVAHGEGAFFADAATLDELERDGQVLFRYVDPVTGERAGGEDDRANPNGSLRAIAGVMNAAGNVAGLMPHPETAVEGSLGHLGIDGVSAVRVGRRVELTVTAASDADARAVVDRLASELLSNPLIESYDVEVLGASSSLVGAAG